MLVLCLLLDPGIKRTSIGTGRRDVFSLLMLLISSFEKGIKPKETASYRPQIAYSRGQKLSNVTPPETLKEQVTMEEIELK
jgi:hypothetical protein